MESKNDDPNGCPDTVLGDCEPVCARCGRDMSNTVVRVREAWAAAQENDYLLPQGFGWPGALADALDAL